MKSKYCLIALLGLFTILSIALAKTAPTSLNEISRLYQAQSVITDGDLVIFEDKEKGKHIQIDVVYDGEHWYSDKLALFSVLTGFTYDALFDSSFYFLGKPPRIPIEEFFSLVLLFSLLPAIILIYLFYSSLSYWKLSPFERCITTASLAFSALIFPYTTVYSLHVLLALLWFSAFMLLIRLRNNPEFTIHSALAAGFLMGAAGAIDESTSFFLIIAMIVYLRFTKHGIQAILYFIGAGIPWLILFAYLNYLKTGTLLPWHIIYGYFFILEENGGRYVVTRALEFFQIIKNYGIALVARKNALFLTMPALLFSGWVILKEFISSGKYSREAMLVAFSSIAFFLAIFSFTTDFGGETRVLRWMIPFAPLWMWFIGGAFKRLTTRAWRRTLIIVLCIQMIISLPLALDPWNSRQDFTLMRALSDLMHEQ